MAGDADTDVYRVGVQVVPDADGFETRLKAQVDPAAARVGRDISEKISNPIGRRIVAAIFGGVRDGGRAATAEAAKEGDNAGAAFGRVAKARITAALKSIPDIQLDADASKAEKTAARLRAELAALSARIEVTDNFDGELLKIRLIKAELATLARQIDKERAEAGRHAIPLNVDAGQAHFEIGQLDREIRAFQREAEKRTRIRVDDDSSGARAGLSQLGNAASDAGRRISFLVAAGLAIGPAIVPGAAAAVGALFAIGVAATGALAGVAVLGLGFSGIAGAVQEMGKAQTAGGGAASSYASQQRQVADAVERVHDAERNLGEQQRELVRVQEDITRAREDAAETLERLANSAEGGAISERQAVIDLERARRDLNKTLADRTASGEDRAQAQIDFDRAMLRLKEQRQENARTFKEKAEADAKGIEQSDQVVEAQERVRKQTLQVESAQRDLARAQRDAAAAAVEMGTAGGGGIDLLKQKMDALSPAGRRFALFLYSLKPALLELRNSVQGGFLPGVEQSIRNVLPMVPSLTAFLTGLGMTMGDLADETTRSLGNPVWQSFFAYIGRTAGPVITGLVRSVRNLAEGFVGLVTAFAPVSAQVGGGIVSLTAKFRDFGATAATNPEFQRFLAYVQDRGPQVVKTLGYVARAILDIAVAIAPIGDVSLKILQGLSNVIHAIPTPLLTALLAVIIPLTGALKLFAAASAAWAVATKAWSAAQLVATGVATKFRDAIGGASTSTRQFGFALTETSDRASKATTGTSAFGKAVSATQGGINAAKGAATGLLGVLGGPWGLALAGAAVAITAIGTQAADQEQKIDDLAAALLRLGQAYKQTGSIGSQVAQEAILSNKTLTDLLLATRGTINPNSIAGAAGGNAADQKSVMDAIRARQEQLQAQQKQLDQAQKGKTGGPLRDSGDTDAYLAASSAIRLEAAGLGELQEALAKTFPEAERLRQAQLLLAASATQYASPAAQRLAELQGVLASSTATATEKIVAQAELNKLLAQAHISQSEAAEALGAAIDGMTAAVQRNGTSLLTNTAAGRENRDAIETRAQAIYDAYQADLAAGVGTEKATYRFYEQIRALIDNAGQLGLNADAVLELVNTYGQVPSVIKTYVELSGYNLTHEQLLQLTRDAANLAQKYKLGLDTAADLITKGYVITSGGNIRYANAGGHAAGGMIGGVGTGTSDSNIARVSKGEFVHRTAAVSYYGPGLMYAINDRRIPRQAFAGFATGGMVGATTTGGGYRPPGLSVADRFGRPSQAPTDWQSMGRGQGSGRTVNIYPQTVDFTLEQLQAQQSRQDTLERVGRQN